MPNNILLVFEGSRREVMIFNKVRELFFKNSTATFFYSYFDAEVFQLCQKIIDDEFLDLIEILRERAPNDSELLTREFSEIYLFFDHDGHSHPEVTSREYYLELKKIFTVFNNETEQGKIYLSYPMIEALIDCGPLSDEEDCCLA